MVDHEIWRTLMENERTMLQYCLVGIAIIGLGFLIKDKTMILACLLLVVGVILGANGVFHYLIRRNKILEESEESWF